MRTRNLFPLALPLLVAGTMLGCSNTNKSPDVSDKVKNALEQAGYKDVSVSQDRDKGVVTLGGTVATDNDKQQAESVAKANAESLVIADEIAVRPPGDESTAKTVDEDTDKAIEKDLDAALVKSRLNHDVKYDVKNGVVTLTGKVPSQGRRAQAEKLASGVPNVKQVVNELEIKGQKATSSGQG